MLPFVLGFLMGILMVGLGVITHKGVVAMRQHRDDLFNHKVELEIARCDRHVVELRDRRLAAVSIALRIEVRRADRILDDRVIGEVGEPGLLVVRDRRLTGALARQVHRGFGVGDGVGRESGPAATGPLPPVK